MFELMIKEIEEVEGKEIKGIVHYTETPTRIYIDRNGKTYMFRKETKELVIFG